MCIGRREFFRVAGVIAGTAMLVGCGVDMGQQEQQEQQRPPESPIIFTDVILNTIPSGNVLLPPNAAEITDEPTAEGALRRIDSFWREGAQIRPGLFTESDAEAVRQALEAGGIPIQPGIISQEERVRTTRLTITTAARNPEELTFIVPVMQVAPEALSRLNEIVQILPALPYVAEGPWLNLFHWLSHMPDAGQSIWNISAGTHYLNTIVRETMGGNGQIYYRVASDVYQEAYIFVTRMNNGQLWMAPLAQNGAPITTYSPGIRGGNYLEERALRLLDRQIVRGLEPIGNVDRLPPGIRNNWGTANPPSNWRIFQWAVAYQVQQLMVGLRLTAVAAAERLGEIITTLPQVPIIIAPSILFDDWLRGLQSIEA